MNEQKKSIDSAGLDDSKFSQQIIPSVLQYFEAGESELMLLRAGNPPEQLTRLTENMPYEYAAPENIVVAGALTAPLPARSGDRPEQLRKS